MTDNIKNERITIQGAANKLHIKKRILEDWIEEGRVLCTEGNISLFDIQVISSEMGKYISLESFLKERKTERFDPKYYQNRNKYIDYLEENEFFGINVIYPDELKYPYELNTSFYFKKEDLQKVISNSTKFFEFFGLTEEEKCIQIINSCSDKVTKGQLEKFFKKLELYTPSTTAFFEEAIKLKVLNINEKEIVDMIQIMPTVVSKDLLIAFCDFSNQNLSLGLGKIDRKKGTTTKEIGAYPYSLYVKIAKSIFNEDKIIENKVLEKSFEKSIDFETWLYLSIHFVCGWRSKDICNNWQYVSDKQLESLGLDVSQLKEKILGNNIPDDIFIQIGEYIEKRIELAGVKAHKTGKASDLLAPIGTELKCFFGRMALISAYHRNQNRNGVLIDNRAPEYQNFYRIRNLLGNDIYEEMGRTNINSRKLNKSYLQSIEKRARQNGAGTMAAYTIASYARNHSDVDTTAMYINDHGLNGETAEVVLSMMLDRGVFGTIRYKELLAAFPEAFGKLSAKEQTQILAACETSAYEMEIICSDMNAQIELKKSFSEGDKDKALLILQELFEISQGFGKSKDEGVFCKKRALGFACENPTCESCIANVCPYLVFTETGIRSLIDVIYMYVNKAKETKNPKYKAVLEDIIIPSYKNILADISKKMKPEETAALKKAIEEYNGKYTTNN